MKRFRQFVTIVSALACAVNALAQTDQKEKDDNPLPWYTAKEEGGTRDVTMVDVTFAPAEVKMIQAPPAAAQATRYADFPVSYGLGLVDVSIPLYTIQSRSLMLPIYLSYNTGGIRVEEVSGPAGLGWTLEAGGVITRTVNGILDGDVNGWSTRPPLEPTSPYFNNTEYLKQAAKGECDVDADLFSFNFCGHKGSFYWDRNTSTYVPVSATDLDIQRYQNSGFVITDTDGTRYYFTETEVSGRYLTYTLPYFGAGGSSLPGTMTPVTAWYLTRIVTMDGTDEITLDYDSSEVSFHTSHHTSMRSYQFTYRYHADGSYTWLAANGTWSGPPAVATMNGAYVTETTYTPKYLKSITYAGGKVSFKYGNNPVQHFPAEARRSYPKLLKSFRVNPSTTVSSDTTATRVCTFSHKQTLDKRNLLDGVWITGRGMVTEEAYTLSYIGENSGMGMDSRDLFGYHNGASNNGTAFLRLFEDNGTFNEDVADRSYNSSAVSMLSLEAITTASGAKTKFFYEGNSIPGGSSTIFSTIGIGHRVSHIVTYDLSNGTETAIRTRTFEYSSPGITIPTAAFNQQAFLCIGEQFREDLADGTRWWCSTGGNVKGVPRTVTVAFCDQSVLPGVPLEGARIYYGAVTERVYDGLASGPSVRTDYLFDSSNAVHSISGGTLPTGTYMDGHDNDNNTMGGGLFHFFQRMPSQVPRQNAPPSVSIVPVWSHYVPEDFPQITAPVTIKRYKRVGSTDTLISQTDNEYDYSSSSFYMGLQARNLITPGTEAYMNNLDHFQEFYYACINQKRIWYRLTSTTETEWLDDGNSRQSVTTFTYIPPSITVPPLGAILEPSSATTVYDADPDRTYVRTFSFPAQLSQALPWADSLANLGYRKPVMETLTGGTSGSTFSNRKAVQWKTFTPVDGGSSFIRPWRISFARKNPGDSQESVARTVYYDAYDHWGNPVQISESDQPTRVYLWGYGGTRPVMEVLGDTYAGVSSAANPSIISAIASGRPSESDLSSVRNSLEPSGNYSRQVSWYHYDSPFGMTAASDVSGRITRNTYDGVGRLVNVKDEDGKLISSYTYNLTVGSAGTPNSISSVTHTVAGTSSSTAGVKDVAYFDGLGRTLQTVAVGASIATKDLITPFSPDFLDREDARVYVSYPDISSATAGSYRSNALTAQQSFYGSGVKAYTENTYEFSSRNRIIASSLPEFTETTTVSTAKSGSNTVLKLSYNKSSNTISANGYYASGRFVVTTTEGPDGSQIKSFTDEFGTPVLERVKLDVSGTYADTYYIKDAIGHVLCVVPPDQAVQLSSSTSGFSAVNCYTYEYDGRDHITKKQLPSQAEETIVYNDADLPTSRTRRAADGMADEVYATTYDGFNRPTLETYKYGNNTAVTLAEYAYDSYPSWAPAFAAESGYVSTSDKDSRTRGIKTAERITLLPGNVAPSALTTSNTSAKTARAFYYDAKVNLRQLAQSDATGGTTRISSTYGFAGNLLTQRQRIIPASGQSAHTLDRTYTYDGRLRPVSVSASLDGGSAATEMFQYSIRQQLANINRGSGTESTTLSYTLQDWLSSAVSTSWEETLRYASPSRTATDALPGKAGIITEWTQQQKGTTANGATTAETYAYSYDKAGRLTSSVRYVGTSTSSVNTLTEKSITYDQSGNLLTLNRYGASSGTTPTESLSFTYSGPKRTGWSYDSHGNVTSDPVSSTTVAWNILDMPGTLTSGSAGTQRAYLADGTLVQVSDGSSNRLYLGDMVFNQTSGTISLESAAWDGGRLLPGSGTDKVLYYVTDHLGSVRVVKDGSGDIRQRFDYYPYGSVTRSWTSSSTTDNSEKRFRFGGKEITGTVLGALSNGADKYLDFRARLYSPVTAMWLSQDPLAEKYYPLTPYMYCAGSPGNVVDPEGEDIAILIIDGLHMAILIQNEKNKWEYFSVNGDNVYISGVFWGGRPFDDLGNNAFDSPQEFLSSYFNQKKGGEGKEDKTIANYDFVSAYIIETDKEHIQDTIIKNEFISISAEEPYNFINNNCVSAVQRSLLKGGIETRQPFTIGSPTGVIYKGMRFPMIPANAYRQIQTNNPGYEIFRQ